MILQLWGSTTVVSEVVSKPFLCLFNLMGDGAATASPKKFHPTKIKARHDTRAPNA
jgi:hypothetical protein